MGPAARPDLHEVDVDLVVHVDADGRSGPAVSFATTARSGDVVGESALATGAATPGGERGMPKAHVDFVGCWKHGAAAPS